MACEALLPKGRGRVRCGAESSFGAGRSLLLGAGGELCTELSWRAPVLRSASRPRSLFAGAAYLFIYFYFFLTDSLTPATSLPAWCG